MTNWLTGWGFRKSHIITASAGAGTNYQTCIKVYKTTGTDGTEVLDGETIGKVYVGANCRDDFGDIRFTDNDGDTLLDYYMERLSSGVSAVFWVEVKDDLSTDPVTIYIYYGKADATTTSNMATTFIDSNDWNDLVVGWSEQAKQSGDAYDAASGWLYENKGATQGGLYLKKTLTAISKFKMHIKMKAINGRDAGFALKSSTSEVIFVAIAESAANIAEYYTTGYHTIFTGVDADAWYHFILKKVNATTDTYDIYVYDANWALKGSVTGVAFRTAITTIDSIWANTYLANCDGGFDDYYMMKYVDPEPAHSTWGTEESGVNNYTRTITDYVGGLDSKVRFATLYKIISDKIGCLEVKSRIVSLHRVFTDKIGAVDSVISSTLHWIYRTIIEKIGMSDTRSRIATLHKTITDKIGGLDTRLRKVSLHRLFTDKLGLKDTKSRMVALHRVFIDKLSGLDTHIVYKARLVYRMIIEYIGLKDSKSRKVSLHRMIYEYVGLKEKSIRLWNWFRRLYKYKDREHPRQQVGKTGD
jgi:hypothetical protein